MADFSSDESLKVPVSDLKKRLVMEKRETVNYAITKFYQDGARDADELRNVRSALISLFTELGEHVKRFYTVTEYHKIKNLIYKPENFSKERLGEAYELLDAIIYDVIDANKEPLL